MNQMTGIYITILTMKVALNIKHMKLIKLILGMEERSFKLAEEVKSTKFTTTYPKDQLTEAEWCSYVRFGLMHGKNIVHFN